MNVYMIIVMVYMCMIVSTRAHLHVCVRECVEASMYGYMSCVYAYTQLCSDHVMCDCEHDHYNIYVRGIMHVYVCMSKCVQSST
jgi:hypothetical protein